jgi:hypothetical protein
MIDLEKARENERSVAKARELGNLLNCMSIHEDQIAVLFQDEHRTLQQALTRLSVAWLKVCGSPEYRYDGRNEASAHVGQTVRRTLEDAYLPFI